MVVGISSQAGFVQTRRRPLAPLKGCGGDGSAGAKSGAAQSLRSTTLAYSVMPITWKNADTSRCASTNCTSRPWL